MVAGQTHAAPIIFTGGRVTVTLANTAGSSTPTLAPGDVLTAVYFNLAGGAVLTPLSAVALGGLTPPQGSAQNAALHGAHSGISSAPGGLNYGIVPTTAARATAG